MSKVYTIQKDGSAWSATNDEFINLQESIAGFGDTPVDALTDLLQAEQRDEVRRHEGGRRMLAKLEVPEKLHELVDLALDDLRAVERDPRYEIDMDCWYRKSPSDKVCSVCLAGSVLVRSGRDFGDKFTTEVKNGGAIASWMVALNYLRSGNLEMAILSHLNYLSLEDCLRDFEPLGVEWSTSLKSDWVNYEDDRDQWFKNMKRTRDLLEKYEI